MIDSHCHLDHEPLVQNIEDILAKCKKEGVQKLLTISTTLNGFPKILEIINKDEIIFGTFGIHPHETNNDQVSKDEIIKKINTCLLYTSPSPRDISGSRMPSSA